MPHLPADPGLHPLRGIRERAIVSALLVALAGARARAAEEPKRVGLKESVQVNLVALEVTVWPKEPGPDACLGLTKDDFELVVDGKPQPIYAADSLGATEEVSGAASAASAGSSEGGMSFVLFFDLWHLDRLARDFPVCPSTKPLAFDEARRFVREEFHDGDRLLLVTAEGWPVVHYGWIRTRADASAALDRLEKTREVVAPHQDHLQHNGWIAGMESFFLALGRYPGRKDVIYLADDFRFDDVAMRMYEIAARAQSNGVVVNAVDLLDSCRRISGYPCIPSGGGLGCTMFREPVALTPLAEDTGGMLFRTDSIAAAARELRSMRKCRYLVSFRRDPGAGKRPPSVRLGLRAELRNRFSLRAPSSYQTQAMAPSQADNDRALFLLPEFGHGIRAEVALWPYRPSGKSGRWKVFVLARVDRTDEEAWPDDVSEIKVNVLLHRQSKGYGQYTKTIAGAELEAFRRRGGTGPMLFPLDEIRSGETTVDLTVTGNEGALSANVSKSFEIPKPPGPGEARPWFLSDHLDRIGETAVLAPSFDDVVTPGRFVAFMGYGCAQKDAPSQSYTASLVPSGGGPTVPLPMTWLRGPDGSSQECGWIAGKVDSPLTPGLWTFKPPAGLGADAESSEVAFTVVSAIAPEGVAPAR